MSAGLFSDRDSARVGARVRTRLRAVDGGDFRDRADLLATEEPLEIRVVAGRATETVAVTMRTPGADFELAVGLLHSARLLAGREGLREIRYCMDRGETQRYNLVHVDLDAEELPDLRRVSRTFYASSACGVCGSASLDALSADGVRPVAGPWTVSADTLRALPDRLREAQSVFASTGGLHAAGLFTRAGELACLREDVGRHNAVDKAVGWALLGDRLPLDDHLLVVSGRTSYEILEKAVVAGVPLVAAVSAPSSLAVEVAQAFGVTLVGFLRGQRFNIYSHPERIAV